MKLNLHIMESARALPENPLDPGVQVWRNLDGTVCAYGEVIRGHYWMHLPQIASFRFAPEENEVWALAQPPLRVDLVQDAYRRDVLPMILQVRGYEVLHASAVCTSAGVIALCGISGTGKSTTAYGLSLRGYPLWADDAVAIELSRDGLQSLPLPFKVHLRPASVAVFARDRGSPGNLLEPRLMDHADTKPVPLAAIGLLERVPSGNGAGAVTIIRLSSTHAFTAVLAHAYCFNLQHMERNQCMVKHYLDLVAAVPVFVIRFVSGMNKLPALLTRIERLLKELGSVGHTVAPGAPVLDGDGQGHRRCINSNLAGQLEK